MDNKTKVLFCINKLGSGTGIGGAERLVVDDINEMLSKGYSVRLLTFKKESEFSLVDECHLDKKYWDTVDFTSLFNLFDWIRTYKYIKRENPDVVFSHLWFSNIIVRIICKLAGVKNVVSFEHNIYDAVKNEKMYDVDRFLQRWSKKIVAVSSAVRDSLVEHGIDKNKIVVVNNGIDISRYDVVPDLSLKKNLGIPENSFVFITIARLIHQKGIDVLLNSFSKLSGNPALVIVGKGSEEDVFRDLAKELGIADRVYFLGIRHDIPEVLSFSDCFVLASRYEGLGIVVLEAMASKKTVIISDFKAGEDMIKDGKEGIVVKKEDEAELVKAMEKVMNDSSLRKNLSVSAFQKVQEFSIQNHVNKIMSI